MTDILADVRELKVRVAELERTQIAGGADRHLTLEEVAARIGPGRAPSTLRRWMKSATTRRRLRLDLLLLRDVSGRYFSTPRRLELWQQEVSRKFRSGGTPNAQRPSSHHVSAGARLLQRFAEMNAQKPVSSDPPVAAPAGDSNRGGKP